jgi:geranylgeranyl diphosphate synthase type II
VVDLESEGKSINPSTLEYIHRSKTGALLTACTRCGGLASGADDGQLELLTGFGEEIGLAFQIVDDILDVTATSGELGKTSGKDQKVKKATYTALFGVEASRRRALELVSSACRRIESFEGNTEPLCGLANFICSRSN